MPGGLRLLTATEATGRRTLDCATWCKHGHYWGGYDLLNRHIFNIMAVCSLGGNKMKTIRRRYFDHQTAYKVMRRMFRGGCFTSARITKCGNFYRLAMITEVTQ